MKVEKMIKKLTMIPVAFGMLLAMTGSASAATSLISGGDIRLAAGWTNSLPSATSVGSVAVDGIIGSSVFGYGSGAVVNHTAGNIVAAGTQGFNMTSGTWNMSGGSLTARYFNANGSSAIFNISGGTVTLANASGTRQFQLNSGGSFNISGTAIIDGTYATASPLVGTGTGYNIATNWTGSWIQGNHSGTDWKTVLTGDVKYTFDGAAITSTVFDNNFTISADGITLTQHFFTDTDNDGMDDTWETDNGLDVGTDDSALDNDSNGGADGLTNLEEYMNRSDPQDADTDDDGLLDGVETLTGIYVSPSDTGTDPTMADTDGDGIDDNDEILQGTNPVDRLDPSKGPITVYLLGGQSNMEGSAYVTGSEPVENLPEELYEIPEILLYVAGSSAGTVASLSNKLIPLQLHSQGGSGTTMDPSIGFGEKMRDVGPAEEVALLKYSYRGTNLHTDWDPGADNDDTANWGPQYTAFVNTITNGLAALKAEGWEPEIKGMLWMQGESDAGSTTTANAYGDNLKAFIGRVREQFAADASTNGICFVAGQVLPADNGAVGRDAVRQALLDVDENSGAALSVANTRCVPTNPTDHPLRRDKVHFNWVGILALGRSMAYEMIELTDATPHGTESN